MKKSRFMECDKLFFKYLIAKRGHLCEIHQRECSNIGTMHILSKATHPRLRYSPEAVILACWFGSHFWTHHDSDSSQATYTRERICVLRGAKDWEELKINLKILEKTLPKIDLKLLVSCFKKELETLNKGETK